MLASQWVWQLTKSVSIPAEEQNAGRVVDYFYRMEFHITPRFFSDSNYLFFFFFLVFFELRFSKNTKNTRVNRCDAHCLEHRAISFFGFARAVVGSISKIG